MITAHALLNAQNLEQIFILVYVSTSARLSCLKIDCYTDLADKRDSFIRGGSEAV